MFPDILKDGTRRPLPSTLLFCIYRKQHLLSMQMLLFFSFVEMEKECNDKHFNKGSFNMPQELENLLNS